MLSDLFYTFVEMTVVEPLLIFILLYLQDPGLRAMCQISVFDLLYTLIPLFATCKVVLN